MASWQWQRCYQDCVCSVWAHEVAPTGSAYCASKHAIQAYTDCLRHDLVASQVGCRLDLSSGGRQVNIVAVDDLSATHCCNMLLSCLASCQPFCTASWRLQSSTCPHARLKLLRLREVMHMVIAGPCDGDSARTC